MKIIFIVCSLIGVHSTTNQVRELREASYGLFWRDSVPTVIQLHTNQEGYLAVSYNLTGTRGDDVGDCSGLARLILPLNADFEMGSRESHGEMILPTVDHRTFNLIPGIARRNYRHEQLYLPIGRMSAYGRRYADPYLIIPMHREWVIAPMNPHGFVRGGQLVTTTSTSHERLQVLVSVSLLDGNPQGGGFVTSLTSIALTYMHDFVITTVERRDAVPRSILDALYHDLCHRRQIQTEPVYGMDGRLSRFAILEDLSDEILETFPIIQFFIHTDSGSQVAIQLRGGDYIGPYDGSRREVMLHSVEFYAFGLNTLSKIALYVDNRNHTIGFGEPLFSSPTTHNLTHDCGWLELRLPNANGELAPTVLDSAVYDGRYLSGRRGRFPIRPLSPFAARVGSMMLVPPSESYPSFRMIESVVNPASFCFGGSIGLADMGPSNRAVTFSASVALIPPGGGRPLTGSPSLNSRFEFQLNTANYEDFIPDDLISLPEFQIDASIEYTIYKSPESSEVVAKIVMGLGDYFFDGDFALLGTAHGEPNQLGVNTLKYIGVYLNYANRQIGFCEPMEYTPTPLIDL